MGKLIKDEFSDLPISRQRKYQLRHIRDGLCRFCVAPALEGSIYCSRHLAKRREFERRKFARKTRYKNARSYELTGKIPSSSLMGYIPHGPGATTT